MSMDSLSDCFTRLRNGAKARKEEVAIPYSRIKEGVLKVLKSEGFLTDFSVAEEGTRKTLKAAIKFRSNGESAMESIRRVSTPGHRVYTSAPTTSRVRSGLGIQILSTSSGVMTDREAIERKVGGEVLGEVY